MTQAARYNAGKPPLHYLLTFPHALNEFAQVCGYGEHKYAKFNYLKGAPLSEYASCLMRHLNAWYAGEDKDHGDPNNDNDNGSSREHLAHVVWNALALCEMAHSQPERDDRPHKVMAEQAEAERLAELRKTRERIQREREADILKRVQVKPVERPHEPIYGHTEFRGEVKARLKDPLP